VTEPRTDGCDVGIGNTNASNTWYLVWNEVYRPGGFTAYDGAIRGVMPVLVVGLVEFVTFPRMLLRWSIYGFCCTDGNIGGR
jgi:hypothetical protein